jgi:RNA polymerase sigma factor (sigma-70 family)
MNGTAMNATSIPEQDRQIAEVMSQERSRLSNFIRKRVPNKADVEDLVQEVFCELVEAQRLLMPIDYVTGWLFRVARNRITDFFRKKRPLNFSELTVADEEGGPLLLEELLPSPEAGPDAIYFRRELLNELEAALRTLPQEQREIFVAHELEGRSFEELSEETGQNINTLLARKRYAVLRLRQRLQSVHDECMRK